jgi:cobyric acid synthase
MTIEDTKVEQDNIRMIELMTRVPVLGMIPYLENPLSPFGDSNSCGKLILKDHIEGCLIEAVKSGKEEEMLKQLNDSIDKFIK